MTQPFYFPDGRVANDAKDLLELCEQYPDDATGFLIRQDLEKWLAYIGSHDAAECAANARQIDTDDRQKLEDFLNRCHSLTAAKPVPEAVTTTETEDNLATSEAAEPISEASPAIVTETPSQEVAIEPETTKSEATKTTEKIATPPIKPATPEATKPSAQPAPKAEISSADAPAEKPSFFQVVARFFVKIFYRDKA
ncbi:MAG: hypothetical protein AAF652_03555 [Cyanobacteria bacterium P01_C01_bin.72]